ncbi:TMP-TENI-domain-containing protein [Metschnikowia bicuspidata var. bicuspidata NRRL YB-4993]|uniref:TMP-TENI-domain-containing protein n=1 Tax=Metschnikowia bicuspidata var. bicuspidata NRRL YB-4993 TaxID=869754 RepID=A0A1A0HC34_9ASCO|nr:TMP-TENI-domain-containing protein [Metschnikowia bicuspidata var. bicuspidata NRRL YB-4993]OBA21571.1 TMP-TENI-domain-containing protein [Metschnikowia bicuspidata var. bicuspidata NRRL YB-4993]
MPALSPDYSVYLVTDSTMVPESSTFLRQVQKAVENGATIVQLREKNMLTQAFVAQARSVLEITRKHGVPLIINDRIDVALAIDADGVHIGQDDMPAGLARKLLGPDKILGVSCSSEAETAQVCSEAVADYVGLGTVYATQTKNTKSVCGPIGTRRKLDVLRKHNEKNRRIACVAIGGINQGNVAKVLYQCQVPGQKLNGVAVVSCIMAAEDAGTATRDLVLKYQGRFSADWTAGSRRLGAFHAKPLVHHITNNVVKNFSANVTLAVGGSPIMSELPAEFAEFAALAIPGSLVMNLGTPNLELLHVLTAGLHTYNLHGKPVVFDPVGAGASKARMDACHRLLSAGQFAVIKGNLGEIMALQKLAQSALQPDGGDSAATMQGVDSTVEMSDEQIAAIALAVSQEYRAVVVVSGAKNTIAQAPTCGGPSRVEVVQGGHPIMGSVTGTGCSLGSTIGCFVACASHSRCGTWQAAVDAVKFYNKAGARAANACGGPGDFSMRFLDELAREVSAYQ